MKKEHDSINKINKIKYFCQVSNNHRTNENDQEDKRFCFSSPTIRHTVNKDLVEVNLDPKEYSTIKKFSPLNDVNDKWFINLSHHNIPRQVQCLLQLGQNFSMPVINIKNSITQLIKNIENNIIKLDAEIQTEIRNRSIPILHNMLSKPRHNNLTDVDIIELLEVTKKFLKSNPDIIYTRADKGSVTVALDKKEYICKVEDMLKDTETYIEIKKDPTKKLTKDTREILTRWKTKDYITQSMYNVIYCSDGNLPRAYGLPKIHKPGLKFRIIIASLDSPTYALANFIHKIIAKNISIPPSHIKNSYQLVKQLKDLVIDDDMELISLDVISLFTNVPMNLALNSINKRWSDISKGTKIPKNEFIKAIELILDSTFFGFNNKIYKQKFGTPMGSPLSPILADLVLQDLEMNAIENLSMEIPFYYRYVDDIALAVPRQKTQEVLAMFNSFHPRMQFIHDGKKLDFLDVTIINNNNKVEFNWYRKPTFSGRVLNFMSHHPLTQKKGVIMNMVDRAFLLSHPGYHQDNLNFVVKTFLSNGYPLQFIFDTIQKRLKSLFNKRTKKQNTDNSNDNEKKGWFIIPFISKVTENFKHITNIINTKLAYFSLHKLGWIVKAQKDSLPILSNKNVVYRLACKNCNASYVGQTKRRLSTRISEHRNDINKKTSNHSVITEHKIDLNHDFDWDKPKILDKENYYFRRLTSEMINIKTQIYPINLQSDTECLQLVYNDILNKLK